MTATDAIAAPMMLLPLILLLLSTGWHCHSFSHTCTTAVAAAAYPGLTTPGRIAVAIILIAIILIAAAIIPLNYQWTVVPIH